MKSFMLSLVVLTSLNVFAYRDDSTDRDPIEIYRSWCDSNNVMTNAADGQVIVAENCASTHKTCLMNQRTQGHYVIYTASCQERDRDRDKGDPRDRSDK